MTSLARGACLKKHVVRSYSIASLGRLASVQDQSLAKMESLCSGLRREVGPAPDVPDRVTLEEVVRCLYEPDASWHRRKKIVHSGVHQSLTALT